MKSTRIRILTIGAAVMLAVTAAIAQGRTVWRAAANFTTCSNNSI